MTYSAAKGIEHPRHWQLLLLLNRLLEAERAGAAVLRLYVEDYTPGSAGFNLLHIVQLDEAANCSVLVDLIRHLNGYPSLNTGDFLEKARTVSGKAERLRFLNRGQEWVVRKIREALPLAPDARVQGTLKEMLDSHENNIRDCECLIDEETRI